MQPDVVDPVAVTAGGFPHRRPASRQPDLVQVAAFQVEPNWVGLITGALDQRRRQADKFGVAYSVAL